MAKPEENPWTVIRRETIALTLSVAINQLKPEIMENNEGQMDSSANCWWRGRCVEG